MNIVLFCKNIFCSISLIVRKPKMIIFEWEYYNQMWDVRDKRADHLPLMGIWGPNYMKNRQAMEFKGLMNLYNTVQVVSCMIMWINTWKGGWFKEYNWLCQNVDRNPDPNSSGMLMLMTCYYFYLSKILDFVDTIFFVIRKKNNQITNLHDQKSSLFFGGKKYLTSLQMLQFILIGIKSTLVVSGVVSCGYPWQWSLVTLILMVMFYHLFNEFYKSAYFAKTFMDSDQNGHSDSDFTDEDVEKEQLNKTLKELELFPLKLHQVPQHSWVNKGKRKLEQVKNKLTEKEEKNLQTHYLKSS
ncbi:ELOVL7 [Lepeophtheirus salmonis]|uniref:Elongation of very long chain fatty acids protein n=1 Tax=Lepeophtheirus salmonis TaxID=72036 RepID=A0A7R8CSS6_LEPSM|nr:ELOVL7 [Lepeophtheirus salmonis]CAF2916889.1 ELOVL7 [Lepeophtheirus salmonis]